MNPETGRVYRDTQEYLAAIGRGEPLIEISEDVADAVEAGMALNRHERRRMAAITRTRKCDKG